MPGLTLSSRSAGAGDRWLLITIWGHLGGTPLGPGAEQVLVALVLVVFRYWRGRATFLGGFILSPSATLRVAGLASRVKVEHPTV